MHRDGLARLQIEQQVDFLIVAAFQHQGPVQQGGGEPGALIALQGQLLPQHLFQPGVFGAVRSGLALRRLQSGEPSLQIFQLPVEPVVAQLEFPGGDGPGPIEFQQGVFFACQLPELSPEPIFAVCLRPAGPELMDPTDFKRKRELP